MTNNCHVLRQASFPSLHSKSGVNVKNALREDSEQAAWSRMTSNSAFVVIVNSAADLHHLHKSTRVICGSTNTAVIERGTCETKLLCDAGEKFDSGLRFVPMRLKSNSH